jgi:hypothetical protein
LEWHIGIVPRRAVIGDTPVMGSLVVWSWAWMWLGGGAIALVVAVIAIVGRRADRPRCPRCRYDLTGQVADSSRCPECGFEARSGRDWLRRRRRPTLAALAILAAAAMTIIPFRSTVWIWGKKSFLPRYREIGRGIAGAVTVVREHDSWNDLGTAEYFGPDRISIILADGSRQLLLAEPSMELGAIRSTGMPPDNSPGFGAAIVAMDGSQQGDPSELVVTLPSGGSGGYVTTIIYEIGHGPLRPKSVLTNGWLADENRDGVYEVMGFDGTFAYVWTSGAGSTRPTVAFHVDGVATGFWRIDPQRMRSLAPQPDEIESMRSVVRSADPTSREAWLSPLIRGTLELLYSGRGPDGREFLRAGWRGTADELAAFEREFEATFARSPYATQIRALQTGGIAWP